MRIIASELPQAGDRIEFADDTDKWGIVTCLSDCETCVYYKHNGITFGGAVDISKLRKHATKPRLWQIVTGK